MRKSSRHDSEFGTFTWWPDSKDCSHANENACPTCDHDGYYWSFVDA